jgi:hypothetical protein
MALDATMDGATGAARAERDLVRLLRVALGRGFAIRGARFYGFFVAIGFAAAIWVASRGYGLDATAVALVAQASSVLVWVAGGIASLGLSAPPKDEPFRQGILALAWSRGLDEGTTDRAEVVATIRLLGEVIAVPILALDLFVVAAVAAGPIGRDGWPLLGALGFGIVAAIVLGLVASGCRKWGAARGRAWFLVVMFLPWLLAELVLPVTTARLASIPGLLEIAWAALTRGG